MKKLLLLVIIISVLSMYATTQIEFSANTGDKELDVSLSTFNVEANLNIKTFNADMINSYDITEKKIGNAKSKESYATF